MESLLILSLRTMIAFCVVMASIGINNLVPTIWVDESFQPMLIATILEFVRLHGLLYVYGVWNTLRHFHVDEFLVTFIFTLANNCFDSY